MIPLGDHPNLKEWLMDPSNGGISENKITSISLSLIREGGPDAIADKLELLEQDSVVIVNAINQHDLNTFVLGLQMAEQNGVRFLYHTAASFIPSRAAVEPKPQDLLMQTPTASGQPVASSPGIIAVSL